MTRQPADLFELLCRQLAGRPIPDPPAIPGRVFAQRMDPKDESDPFAERWAQNAHRHEDGTTWLMRRSERHVF
jgi:hypothetical protein